MENEFDKNEREEDKASDLDDANEEAKAELAASEQSRIDP